MTSYERMDGTPSEIALAQRLQTGTQRGEQIIRPQPDRATFISREEVKQLEFGFGGEKPDYILVVSASGIANGGPTTQLYQIGQTVSEMFASDNIPTGFVGPKVAESSFVDSLAGYLPPQVEELAGQATTIPDRFTEVADGFTRLFMRLAQDGRKNILVISNGYTAFVPYAAKEAINRTNAQAKEKGFEPINRVKLIMQDSSLPDTDNPNLETDDQGRPLDRFYPPAYASTDNVDVFMVLNNWLPIDPATDANRAPKGIVVAGASFPFSPALQQHLENMRQIDKGSARQILIKMLQEKNPAFAEALSDPNRLFIPFIASNGYFSAENIGRWMTPGQYTDMVFGTQTILESMNSVAQQTGRSVICSGESGFLELADQVKRHLRPESQPNIVVVNTTEDIVDDQNSPKVFILKKPSFAYGDYTFYRRAADVDLHRTSQTNTNAEDVLMGVPGLILTMPAQRYMSVQTMDPLFVANRRQFFPNGNHADIAGEIMGVLAKPQATIRLQDMKYRDVNNHPGSNFWGLTAQIAGINLQNPQ